MKDHSKITARVLNLLILIASLFGYMEWGTANSSFLFEAERVVLSKLLVEPLAVLHPFTLLPLAGQLLLLIGLFLPRPSRVLTFIGVGAIGLLMLLLFFIGIISLNIRIPLSVIPFLVLGVLSVRYHAKYFKMSL